MILLCQCAVVQVKAPISGGTLPWIGELPPLDFEPAEELAANLPT